ncbi:MAG: lipocalin family protein [Pontiellaceae bacterium]|nr:lipocalin family protein [Pontiellaceae bacterium]
MKILLTTLFLMILSGCKSTASLTVVSNFDADHYMGVWYEAARYPHGFEKGLSAVSATYTKNDDGTIKVENRGFDEKKAQWSNIEGVAKFKGEATQGWLRVSFFKPFYGDYKIIALDDEYTKAIITGPTYGYLWLLVRDPDLPQEELNEMVAQAEAFGFDPGKLIMVDQSKNQP